MNIPNGSIRISTREMLCRLNEDSSIEGELGCNNTPCCDCSLNNDNWDSLDVESKLRVTAAVLGNITFEMEV